MRNTNFQPIDTLYNTLMAYNIGKNTSDKTFKIGNENISSLGALYGGLSLVGRIGGEQEYNQRQSILDRINQNISDDDYLNVPYDRRYNNYAVDKYNSSSFQEGGVKGDIQELGYKRHSPYKNNPYIDIHSNKITMKDVDMPLLAQSDTGENRIMYPNDLHIFDNANVVREHKIEFNKLALEKLPKVDKLILKKFANLKGVSIIEIIKMIAANKEFYSNKIVAIVDKYIKLCARRIFEDGGRFNANYEDWQNGHSNTNEYNTEVEDIADYIKDNPMDYDAIVMYNEMFKDTPSVEYDANAQDIRRRKHRPIESVLSYLQENGYSVSSVDDGKHNEHSKHYSGEALDLGLNTTFKGNKQAMQDFLGYYETSLKQKFPSLKLRDERRKPNGQKVWNGSHYHLEL